MTVPLSCSRALLIASSLLATVLGACQKAAPTAPPRKPPAVTVATPAQRAVTNYLYFTGRTKAVESAEIRARVSGFLEKMHFTVSADIEAGAKLFSIEAVAYEAREAQMLAKLVSAEAYLSRAQSDVERVEKAIETNAVSRQEVETRKADRDMAKAAVLEAQANLDQAQLDLSYCTVTSPIEGQVSRNLVDVGNLVGSGANTLLATVAKMDPIHVYFEASEDVVLKWLENHDRTLGNRRIDISAFLGLSNGNDFPYEGMIDYVDNKVEASTGTIMLRAAFPNPTRELFPGLFARIRVPGQEIPNAVVIKEKAIGTDLGGKYVLTVGEGNMVELKHVELGALEGDERVILSGLDASETYIIEGLMRARPGRPCTPQQAGAAKQAPTQGAAAQQG